jgi:23S rRNA (adenine1618-N6)-methyltransferase
MVGATLEKAGATKIEILPMGQGNKLTRIVAWSFLSFTQQKAWKNARWR